MIIFNECVPALEAIRVGERAHLGNKVLAEGPEIECVREHIRRREVSSADTLGDWNSNFQYPNRQPASRAETSGPFFVPYPEPLMATYVKATTQ